MVSSQNYLPSIIKFYSFFGEVGSDTTGFSTPPTVAFSACILGKMLSKQIQLQANDSSQLETIKGRRELSS